MGATEYLTKPVGRDELLDALARAGVASTGREPSRVEAP
jgi:ActR/RegA family two-component response regulator